ncbi:uncharacterized protein Bfra_008991 [Botrytis fragariae]|uniref:DUF1754-domain-containing protein n=1 Tax=Botrytis fragariae TaxID=1964551 RepID=A0A8H6EGY8_9HELO|nr:uncharacterized protein Bfra_008991 [Botrytis fragariae]KAF5871964.1 hypothetical protein Bfra_008991 [Botrytis fragariae]
MPDDYSFTGGGLKLKGASTGAGITKKKKKKKVTPPTTSTSPSTATTTLQKALKDEDAAKPTPEETGMSEEQLKSLDPRDSSGKTASERAHEEMRRRRLNDRLKREGVKTHKERVEELNRYLSTLSEHHDMPKIGPG